MLDIAVIRDLDSPHSCTLLHYNLKLPNVYVGIVGWMYITKIPSFLFPYFFEQWSSLHLFSFHEMLFPLLVPGLFFLSFMVLAMYRVHSSMCMQGQMKEK